MISYIFATKNNAPAIWPNQSDNHVKAGCLARAVRAKQSDDLARACVDVHSIHYRAAPVNFYQLLGGEDTVDLRLRRRSRFRSGGGRSLANHGFGEGEALAFFSFSSVFGS